MNKKDYFIVLTYGEEEPIVLPERYEELEIAKKCAESLSNWAYDTSSINVMEDDSSKVTKVCSYIGVQKKEK